MAFSLGSNSGGGIGRRSRFRGITAMAEINIVPLVDVMMVLLVIFMITANVMNFGMEVDVPKVKKQQETAKELPVITVTKNGDLYLNEKPININNIADELHQRFGNVTAAYVRADKDTIWEAVAQVVSELGIAKIQPRMVTQPMDDTERLGRRH